MSGLSAIWLGGKVFSVLIESTIVDITISEKLVLLNASTLLLL